MSRLPKLKLKKDFGYPLEEIRDFEQAEYFLFNYGVSAIVVVGNQVVNSYEELVRLVNQDCYKDKEFLEVLLLSVIACGG